MFIYFDNMMISGLNNPPKTNIPEESYIISEENYIPSEEYLNE